MKGKDALNVLEWLCTATMDKPILQTTYTLALNDNGGIEGDFTVTRLDDDEFFIVTGASATKHVLSLLTSFIRSKAGFGDIQIRYDFNRIFLQYMFYNIYYLNFICD